MADSPSVPPSPEAFTRTTTAEVERLREKNDRQAVVVAQFQHEYDKVRAELAAIKDGSKSKWQVLCGEKSAEIVRLRQALETYGKHTYQCARFEDDVDCDCGLWDAVKENPRG